MAGAAGGWFIIAALAWITVSGLVLFGSYVIEEFWALSKSGVAALGGLGALSGIVTALFGKSGSTPARGQATSPTGKIANVALAIAGPLFAAILLYSCRPGLTFGCSAGRWKHRHFSCRLTPAPRMGANGGRSGLLYWPCS